MTIEYNWRCLNGHSGAITNNPELEAKAEQRVKDGFLDAICLTSNDCPDCKEELDQYLSSHIDLEDDHWWEQRLP